MYIHRTRQIIARPRLPSCPPHSSITASSKEYTIPLFFT
jgi:hypothetical protein